MYYNDSNILSVLKKLDIYKKYPILKKNVNVANYLTHELSNFKYSRLNTKFLTLCIKYNNISYNSFQNYLEKYCTKDLYKYYCFYQHDLEKFHFCKYLSNFIGKPINIILKLFVDVATFDRSEQKLDILIKPIVRKILDVDLLFRLSCIFAKIDIHIQSNTLAILFDEYLFNSMKTIRTQVSDNIINNKILNLDNEQVIQLQNDLPKRRKNMNIDEFKNYIITIYQNNKKIYDFITNCSTYEILELRKKKCDIDAMINNYYKNDKPISKASILSYIMDNDPWLIIKLLEDEINNFDRIQIKNLQINNKIPTRKIVIEI